jgi:hypothetical protein
VSAIDSYYGVHGKVDAPEDLSGKENQIAALVPEADGSITTIPGSCFADDGSCTIPQVPGRLLLAAGNDTLHPLYVLDRQQLLRSRT